MLELGSIAPRTKTAKFLGEAGLILMLCVAIVAPGLNFSAALPQIRTETMLLLAYAIVFATLLLTGLAKPVRFHSFYIVGILFTLTIAISLTYGTLVLNHELSYRDFFEIPKCWLPVFFFTIAYEAELSEKGLHRLLNVFAGAAVLVCFFGWAQFLNLGIAARLTPYYADMGHNYGVLIRYKRIFSTVGNPNSLGQLISWILSIYVLAFLFGVGNRLRNLSIALMCVITVALTSSRYGLLASGAGLLLAVGLAMSARRRGMKLLALFVLIAVLVPAFSRAQHSFYLIGSRFEELKNPLQAQSLRGRLDYLWIEAGDFVLSSLWVGHGPAKKIFEDVYTDSEYLNVLKFYGLLGFPIYMGYYLWPLTEIAKALKRLRSLSPQLEERMQANLLVIRASFTIFCLALLMNIGEFTFYNLQLLAFLWLWAGLGVRAAHFVSEIKAQESVSVIAVDPGYHLQELAGPARHFPTEGFLSRS